MAPYYMVGPRKNKNEDDWDEDDDFDEDVEYDEEDLDDEAN